MSIDFSTLQGLTIPEGKVTKITDAVGQVLWEEKKAEMVTVTVTTNGVSWNSDYAKVTIDGQVYDGSTTHELTLPVGTIIHCKVDRTGTSGSIILNGTNLGSAPLSYDYEVISDCTIQIWDISIMGKHNGMIVITDANA